MVSSRRPQITESRRNREKRAGATLRCVFSPINLERLSQKTSLTPCTYPWWCMPSPQLYGALAAAILQDTTTRWNSPAPDGHGYFTFTAACDVLVSLGVAEAVDTYGSDYDASVYRQYRLMVDGNTAAAVVAERASAGPSDMPPIDEVLAAWLACAFFFKLVSVTPEPFVPHDDVQAVMRELARSGYATQRDGRTRWTDKIAPAMALYHGPDPKLYGALTASLVRLAVGAPPGTPEPLRAVAGTMFHGQALNAFERACMLLMRLGLAYPIDGDGTPVTDHSERLLYAGSFAMAVDGSGIDGLMTERASSGQSELPPLEELMGVWLCCADHVGLSVRRAPFVPADDFRPVLQALVRSDRPRHAVAILLGCRKSLLRGDARTADRCGTARRRAFGSGRRPAHGDRGRCSERLYGAVWPLDRRRMEAGA
jgi:hypothetical protein